MKGKFGGLVNSRRNDRNSYDCHYLFKVFNVGRVLLGRAEMRVSAASV